MAKHKRYYCTGWKSAPSDINQCCHQHDRDYGKNGQISRKDADRRLRECLIKNGHPIKAWLFWAVVRCFGGLFWKEKEQ